MEKFTRISDIVKSKSGYNILFYDFPGCVSAGKTLEETIKNVKIALQMHIEGMIEDKEKIIKEDKYIKPEVRILIELEKLLPIKKH